MLFSTIECYLLKFIKTTSHFRDLYHKNGYIKHKNSKKTATTILNNVIAVECFIFCFSDLSYPVCRPHETLVGHDSLVCHEHESNGKSGKSATKLYLETGA